MYSVSLTNRYILHVEDDSDDVDLLREVLSNTQFNYEIISVPNGIEALKFLEKAKETNRLPEIIFLDLNIARMNGKETFICIKADKQLSRIPLCVLTVSDSDTDRKHFASYKTPYVVKSGDMEVLKIEVLTAMKTVMALDSDFNQSKQNTA